MLVFVFVFYYLAIGFFPQEFSSKILVLVFVFVFYYLAIDFNNYSNVGLMLQGHIYDDSEIV